MPPTTRADLFRFATGKNVLPAGGFGDLVPKFNVVSLESSDKVDICMYICIYVCTHRETDRYTYIHTYTRTHTITYIHIYIYIYMYFTYVCI
jgi:hypothetical protein